MKKCISKTSKKKAKQLEIIKQCRVVKHP